MHQSFVTTAPTEEGGDSLGNEQCFYFCIVTAVRGEYQGFGVYMYRQTRTVRGSDYSPAVELSQQKDQLVTENWRD